MSRAAAHHSKDARRTCQRCNDRKARFSYRGRVRADRNHTLCFECFSVERDRQLARGLAGAMASLTRAADAQVPEPGRAVPQPCARPREAGSIAHRRRMLAHLASAGNGTS